MNPVLQAAIQAILKALPALPGGLPAEIEASIARILTEVILKVLEKKAADPEFAAKLEAWQAEVTDDPEKRSRDLFVLMGS